MNKYISQGLRSDWLPGFHSFININWFSEPHKKYQFFLLDMKNHENNSNELNIGYLYYLKLWLINVFKNNYISIYANKILLKKAVCHLNIYASFKIYVFCISMYICVYIIWTIIC